MSILIRGMEMPTSCDECRIMVLEDTNCDGELYCGCPIVFKAHPQGIGHCPDYCPLIEIPPHGELIDRDALVDDFRGFIAMYDGCPFSQLSIPDKARRDELQAVLAEVINATTIIPTEEGE